MKKKYAGKIGPYLVIILGLFPLVLWWPHSDFSSSGRIFRSVGQLTGLVGFCFYSLNIIMSARHRFIDTLFSGINRAYIFHHLVGVGALILILVHLTTLALSYLSISVRAAAELLIPSFSDLPVLFGIISLGSTIILLILTLFVRLEYNFWKSTHRYLGGAMFFAGIHVLLIPSTVSQNVPLRYYLLSLAVISLGLFVIRLVLSRQYSGKKIYYLKSATNPSPEVTELVLTPTLSRPISFLPGQFVFIEPIARGIPRQSHPFSLTNARSDTNISLAIKNVGDFTATLKLLRPNDRVIVEGPYGGFAPDLSSQANQVWIAGGIGVTPFISMARSLGSDTPSKIVLYYLVKDLKEAVFVQELEQISKSVNNFHLVIHESSRQGRLTADTINQDVSDLKNRQIYICGPAPLMSGLKSQFKKLNISSAHVHTEEFSLN